MREESAGPDRGQSVKPAGEGGKVWSIKESIYPHIPPSIGFAPASTARTESHFSQSAHSLTMSNGILGVMLDVYVVSRSRFKEVPMPSVYLPLEMLGLGPTIQ